MHLHNELLITIVVNAKKDKIAFNLYCEQAMLAAKRRPLGIESRKAAPMRRR